MERRAPWWCYALLAAAVCSVASAGVAFKYIAEVPPMTLAAWRLQLTSCILVLAAALQWRGMPGADKARVFRDWRYSLFSGVALGLHFGTWVWSLQHTSLAHSLLLVSTTPIILVAYSLATRQPISTGEVAGAVLAVAGCAVLASGAVSAKETEVTLLGDVMAFAAAVAVVAHWQAGKHLRTYQPVFVYSAPVTVFAAACLSITGFAAEEHTLIGTNRHGVFGWAVSKRYAPVVVYLGAVPGVVGHQGFNTVLRYVSPLIVSLAVQFEPMVGPFIGWATAVSPAPGFYTYVGGGIIIAATIGATVAAGLRQQKEERLVKTKSMRIRGDDSGGFEAGNESGSEGMAGPAAAGVHAPSGPASYQRCSIDECELSLHPGQHTQRHRHHLAPEQLQTLQLHGVAAAGDAFDNGGASERDQLLPHGAASSSSSSRDFHGAAASGAVFTLDDDGVEHVALAAGGRMAGGSSSIADDRAKQQHGIEMRTHAPVQ